MREKIIKDNFITYFYYCFPFSRKKKINLKIKSYKEIGANLIKYFFVIILNSVAPQKSLIL